MASGSMRDSTKLLISSSVSSLAGVLLVISVILVAFLNASGIFILLILACGAVAVSSLFISQSVYKPKAARRLSPWMALALVLTVAGLVMAVLFNIQDNEEATYSGVGLMLFGVFSLAGLSLAITKSPKEKKADFVPARTSTTLLSIPE